jgi:tellurite resistance protein
MSDIARRKKRMKSRCTATALLAAALLVAVSAVNLCAQEKGDKQQDRMKNETTLSGCLNKDTADMYTLTDETSGAKTAITGPTDLEKHSANHKVTLTGKMKTDSNGKQVF